MVLLLRRNGSRNGLARILERMLAMRSNISFISGGKNMEEFNAAMVEGICGMKEHQDN